MVQNAVEFLSDNVPIIFQLLCPGEAGLGEEGGIADQRSPADRLVHL